MLIVGGVLHFVVLRRDCQQADDGFVSDARSRKIPEAPRDPSAQAADTFHMSHALNSVKGVEKVTI